MLKKNVKRSKKTLFFVLVAVIGVGVTLGLTVDIAWRSLEIRRCKRAIQKSPKDAELYCKLGKLHLEGKEYEDAAKELKYAIGLYPDFADAHLQLGIANVGQGKYTEAIDNLKRSAQLDPTSPSPQLLLAGAYIGSIPQHPLRLVEEHLRKAKELSITKREDMNIYNKGVDTIRKMKKMLRDNTVSNYIGQLSNNPELARWALMEKTGEDFGTDQEKWQQWWDKNKGEE